MAYAYKAVREVKPGVYRSLYGVYPVTYRIGKTTKAPKDTGLICYKPGLDSFNEAHEPDRVLLRVKATGKVLLPPQGHLSIIARPTLKKLKSFWDGNGIAGWPCWAPGSIAYAEVTPLYAVDKRTKKRIK